MAKILNLDEFKNEKTLIHGGKEFVVRAMTTREFVDSGDFDEKMKKEGPVGQVNLLLDLLPKYVTGISREELLAMELSQLLILFHFVRGMDPQPATREPGEDVAKNV